jgi:thiol-disulfide isomerase/thioredoxin
MKEWMDRYVNLYGELATDIILRDSLFIIAGSKAIERARKGHPLVYGWMVDYFFNGYESFNIELGIQMLQQYLNDPNCLTSKRQAINRRLKGIETLVPGTIAPNIYLHDMINIPFELKAYRSDKPHILLLFWSADCSHCVETVEKLYNLCQMMEEQNRLDVIAISLDETDFEIQIWQQKVKELKGWTHLHADEGLNSKVAEDFYILGVPVMILINSQTKEIIAVPDSTEQLYEFIKM